MINNSDISVKTRYIPIVRAIYDRIREQYADLEKMRAQQYHAVGIPGGQAPFNPQQYGPFVPAFNPEGSPFPSYPFGPQLTTPRWLRYEPGLNMVNWNEIHSGSVNPIDNWEARINSDSGTSTHLLRAVTDLFPNKNIDVNPGSVTVYANRIMCVDRPTGLYRLVLNHGTFGTTTTSIELLGSTGLVEVTEEILSEAAAIYTELFELSQNIETSQYLALVIGNYGQIKNIELRRRTSFSIATPQL